MVQFALVPASVYTSKSLNTEEVTKWELARHEAVPTRQTDSPKKEINEKLVAKADSLVDKFFYCSRIKVSNSRAINLDGVETAVIPSDFAQQLRLKKSRRFTFLLDFTGSPWYIYNSTSEPKCQSQRERKLGSFQNMIVKSGEGCTHKVVVLMGLCAT